MTCIGKQTEARFCYKFQSKVTDAQSARITIPRFSSSLEETACVLVLCELC